MEIQTAQRHRLYRAINFARNNLADEIDLQTLADVACYSKYHFTRTFNDRFKESPWEMLTRLRLQCSTYNLVFFPKRPIIDIALDCGFSSAQTFSHAFRRHFGIAPRSYRAANPWRFDRFPRNQSANSEFRGPAVISPETGPTQAPVRFESRPDMRVAYVRNIGPYGAEGTIETAFQAVERWALGRGLWNAETPFIGLCPDHPAVTPARFCLYDACFPVHDNVREDDVVSIQTISAATYAILNVKCTASQVSGIWEWFSSRWLPASGVVRTLLPSYEWYPATEGRRGRPETGVEFCMPVERSTKLMSATISAAPPSGAVTRD